MARAFEAGLREPPRRRRRRRQRVTAASPDRTGFFAWVEGAPAEGYRAPRTTRSQAPGPPAPATPGRSPSRSCTGSYGELVLRPLLERHGFDDVRVLAVSKRLLRRQHRRRRSHHRSRSRPHCSLAESAGGPLPAAGRLPVEGQVSSTARRSTDLPGTTSRSSRPTAPRSAGPRGEPMTQPLPRGLPSSPSSGGRTSASRRS